MEVSCFRLYLVSQRNYGFERINDVMGIYRSQRRQDLLLLSMRSKFPFIMSPQTG